jgi:hypothetical protein
MRYVVGRNRQAATGQLIINPFLLMNFLTYLLTQKKKGGKKDFPDIPDEVEVPPDDRCCTLLRGRYRWSPRTGTSHTNRLIRT